MKSLTIFKLLLLLGIPTCGVLFWLGSGILTEHILSRPYDALDRLQVNATSAETAVTFIHAKIWQSQNSTTVIAWIENGTTYTLEFEFSFTEIEALEEAIAQQLGLTLFEVRRLVRYQIV
ncbi:MAG: hypothetical protein F6K32_10465 [Desertifilum sp. SIO1I2]|nr:hypothetical protein [Desertifilum sp. SIO1I2]